VGTAASPVGMPGGPGLAAAAAARTCCCCCCCCCRAAGCRHEHVAAQLMAGAAEGWDRLRTTAPRAGARPAQAGLLLKSGHAVVLQPTPQAVAHNVWTTTPPPRPAAAGWCWVCPGNGLRGGNPPGVQKAAGCVAQEERSQTQMLQGGTLLRRKWVGTIEGCGGPHLFTRRRHSTAAVSASADVSTWEGAVCAATGPAASCFLYTPTVGHLLYTAPLPAQGASRPNRTRFENAHRRLPVACAPEC
jgi:hypothetical protein